MRLPAVVAAYTALALCSQAVQGIPIAITNIRDAYNDKAVGERSTTISSYRPAIGAREYAQLVRRQVRKPPEPTPKKQGGKGKMRNQGSPKTQRNQGKPKSPQIQAKTKPKSRSPSRAGSTGSQRGSGSGSGQSRPNSPADSQASTWYPDTPAPSTPDMSETNSRISSVSQNGGRPSRLQRVKAWIRQKLRIRDLEQEGLALVERNWLDEAEES